TATGMKLWHSLIFVALLAFCACDRNSTWPVKAKTDAPAAPREVKALHPLRGPITRFITLPAAIKSYREATLYAKVTGYLKSITVDKGDEVAGGALLAEIEVPELVADQAKDKAELELAKLEFQRISEARKKA